MTVVDGAGLSLLAVKPSAKLPLSGQIKRIQGKIPDRFFFLVMLNILCPIRSTDKDGQKD